MPIGQDILGGATQGAITGTAVDPGLGTAIGAVGGGLLGLGSGLMKNAANKKLPGPEPMQVSLLQDLERRAANARTGSAYAGDMAEISAEQGAGARALANSGATGLQQYGLLQRMLAEKKNKVLGQAQNTELAYKTAQTGLTDQIAQRNLYLNMIKNRDQAAQNASNSQAGMQSFQALLAEKNPETGQTNASSGYNAIADLFKGGAGGTGNPVAPGASNIGGVGASGVTTAISSVANGIGSIFKKPLYSVGSPQMPLATNVPPTTSTNGVRNPSHQEYVNFTNSSGAPNPVNTTPVNIPPKKWRLPNNTTLPMSNDALSPPNYYDYIDPKILQRLSEE